VFGVERSSGCLGYLHILIDSAAAGADRTHDRIVEFDRDPAAEDPRAVQALFMAMSTLPSHAPSIRTWEIRSPPASTTAML